MRPAMQEKLSQYNVVWDTPSTDATGSMPIGNGDLAANVWVEPNGDLLLLVAKSDSWDENAILLKLGRIRVAFLPAVYQAGDAFRQELDLAAGCIRITLGRATITVWADANQPALRVDAVTESPVTMTASLECWRREPRTTKTQTGDMFRDLSGKDPYPTVITPDHILPPEDDRLVWCHHNERREHDAFEINLRLQGLEGMLDQMPHPLVGRTFGAGLHGEGLKVVDPQTLASAMPATSHSLQLDALTVHPSTIEQWRSRLPRSTCDRLAHERWWADFWERSWLFIEGPEAFNVTRGYVLQRFMNASAGRGASPIKFNGSLFSVGRVHNGVEDPDWRRWGGPGFWFMNTRLVYWPMLALGDFDLMRPWLNMYLRQLPLQKHRTQRYFGHGGAHYPETITEWGAEVSAHYGWTPFDQRPSPLAECAYVTYYWSGGIELCLVLYEYWRYTGDEAIAREFLLPIADAVTEFYEKHYPRDLDGRIRFEPAQSLETWHWAINPLPEIAGLAYVLPKLAELPQLAERCQRLIDALPPLPVKDGKLQPGEQVDRKKNTENPELYAIFPYRLFGVGKGDASPALAAFKARLHRDHTCWSQDDIQMALLGLTDQAKANVVARSADANHTISRFPAFWDQFHDWVPDMDHGGVLQLATQFMLMQCEGRVIRLLPAWPADWDADFKLHAPLATIVEGKVRGGKVIDLKVTPPERADDVVL